MRITSHTTLIVGKAGKAEEVPPGTPVELDDDEAKSLIARGIAQRAAKAEAKTPEKEKAPEKETQGGKPPADPQGGKVA